MPTQIYKVNGKRVPSVTTILSRFKDSGALIEWAYRCGTDGIDIHQVKEEAATAGTVAHKMVESDIRGIPGPKKSDYAPELWEKSMTGFGNYLEWKESTKLRPYQTELGMVCECHRFGGCTDSVSIEDSLCILDWKFGGGPYVEHICQIAAYGHLISVNYPNMPIKAYHLVRFGKEEADFHHHCWQDLSLAWRQFEIFREAYENDKILKGRL